jgi:hypothetical protein
LAYLLLHFSRSRDQLPISLLRFLPFISDAIANERKPLFHIVELTGNGKTNDYAFSEAEKAIY